MKDEIKKYIIDAGILYPNFNRNVARKKYWDNRNTEWSKYIYEKYEECNKKCRINFADFLRYFFFDEQIQYYYHDTEYFLANTVSLQHNPGTRLYNAFFEDGCKFVDFTPVSMTELIYCFRNNIRSRPKCKECSNDTEFTVYKDGYRKFCSQKCQMKYNNKLKEPKKSTNTIDEIRNIIEKIPLDLRNLSKSDIADNYLNILDYTKDFTDVSVPERIHIFQTNLSINDITCFCGGKKNFVSQGVGYKKTCGKKICIGLVKNPNYYNEKDININVSKGGASFESGFLYVLKSKNISAYKIGISQDPLGRLNDLRKSINDFEIIQCYWIMEGLSKTEKYLHNIFQYKRKQFDNTFNGYTEIFDLNTQDLKYIKDYMYENK